MKFAFEVEGLWASYEPDRPVLKGVTFTASRGRILAILGGSGCGKSTLLRNLIGLHAPDRGRIVLNGVETSTLDRSGWRRMGRTFGVAFQGGALLASMTVGDNVALPLREHLDLPERILRSIVRMKLGLVGLAGKENLYPGELSGGMRKRAALARALALDPAILFLDEPGAGLDPITAASLDRLIVRLAGDFGMTVLMISHEIGSVRAVADRVLMLDGGSVRAEGTVVELEAAGDPWIDSFFSRESATADGS